MPPRPSVDRDSAVHYEPLRASVLDVFEQLGAFDDQSGIVDWIFPEFHEQKELKRTRVKLTEVFGPPEPEEQPEPETPRKSRTSRFFRLGTKSRSKSRTKKETKEAPSLPTPSKESKKPKRATSSPNLREDAAKEEETSAVPPIPSPMKQTATSPEHKSRRLSLFPRKAAASLDQPRPSISDEEWQQITMTGSIADYEANPFLGNDPHGSNHAGPVKREKYFSRFTSGFTRSTPSSPTREHAPGPISSTAPTSPTRERATSPLATPVPTPLASEHNASGTASPPAATSDGDPTTPTGPYLHGPTSPAGSAHSNASTSTLPATPTSPAIQEVSSNGAPKRDTPEIAGEEGLEITSQIDHVRKSLSDISEGEHSESSTLSVPSENRNSQASAPEEAS
ncbi:hypothetical protein K438DRAFT_1970590 [Mycena galopus ATCC 62051]|nr:hypothetical protein K438DRAFT_1970590 [Mycena galopus ATCC 62051]